MTKYYNIKYNTLPQQVEENRKKIADLELDIGGKIFIVVSALPTTGDENKIYLVPSSEPETQNSLDEFIWVDNAWEKIGSVSVDLSNYYNKGEVDGLLSAKVNANNPITAGTSPKITYDEKGLVTGTSDLVASDIPQLAPSKITQSTTARFVTDAEKSTWNGKQNALTAGDGISIVGDVISADSGIPVEEWNTPAKTLSSGDANKLFKCSHTASQLLIIPPNATTAFPIGTMITFLLTSTYEVAFSGDAGVTLTSMDSLIYLKTQYGMASLIKTDTNTWQLLGALT